MINQHLTTTIEELEATISRLRWDTSFGMLNPAGLHEAIRQLPEGQYTVIFADVDHMKHINSATGSHCKTDRYLTAGLKVREGEIAGRIHGDDHDVCVRPPRSLGPRRQVAFGFPSGDGRVSARVQRQRRQPQ